MKIKMTQDKLKISNEAVECCQVCRTNRFDNGVFKKMVCQGICNKRVVHKFCYNPEYRDVQHFKCDQCKRNEKDAKCEVCFLQNGILKQLNNNSWTHVICGLYSPKIKLANYRTLQFKINNNNGEEIQVNQCQICGRRSKSSIKCFYQSCQNYLHPGCILGYKLMDNLEVTLIYGMLDKNQGAIAYNLMNYPNSAQNIRSLSYMNKNEPLKLLCHNHTDEPYFVNCICNKQSNSDIVLEQINCDVCKRWYHLKCSGVKIVKPDQQYQCEGCRENNMFKKTVFMAQLLQRLYEIENKEKITPEQIKFLDSISFKFSQKLKNKLIINKNIAIQIDKYQSYKILQRYYLTQRQGKKSKINNHQKRTLQMLYVLINNQIKQFPKITQQDREDCLKKIKRNVNWGSQKMRERYEYFLKTFVQPRKQQSRRESSKHQQHKKSLKKEQQNKLEQKIKEFIEQNKKQKFQIKKIVQNLYQTIKLLQRHELKRQILQEINSVNPYSLISVIYKSEINIQQLKQILQFYQQISLNKKRESISKIQILKILQLSKKIFHFLPDNKNAQLYAFFKHIFDQFNAANDSSNNQSQDNDSTSIQQKDLVSIKNKITLKITGRALCTPAKSNIIIMLQNCVDVMKNQLDNPMYKQYEQFYLKYCFFLKILIEHYYPNFLDEEKHAFNQLSLQQIQKIKKIMNRNNKELRQVIQQILTKTRPQNIKYIYNLCNFMAQKGIKLNSQQLQITKSIINFVVSNIYNTNINYKINRKDLDKICLIVSAFKRQNNFSQIFHLRQNYRRFQQSLQKLKNYQVMLTLPKQNKIMLQQLVIKIKQIKSFNIFVQTQNKQLKALYNWAFLSDKYHQYLNQYSKIVPNAIKAMYSLMETINYPENSLRKNIQKLQKQSSKCLDTFNYLMQKIKSLKPEQNKRLQIYEQLYLFSRKPSIQQIQNLIINMTIPLVDFSYQQIFLEQISLNCPQLQIQNNLQIQNVNLRQWVDVQHQSHSLLQLKVRLLQSPVKRYTLQDFNYLIQKIYQFKCQEYHAQISYKQYKNMLHYGGTAVVNLLNKSQLLLNAYKSLEDTKILYYSPRRNKQVSYDEQKLKKIKRQIIHDSLSCKRVDHLTEQMSKIRQKIVQYRKNMTEWHKYIQLINQAPPVAMCVIPLTSQIYDLKKQVEELSKRSLSYISIYTSYNNITIEQILKKYKEVGIKDDSLQKLQTMSKIYCDICDQYKELNPKNYQLFSDLCDHPELSRNISVIQMRQSSFDKMYHLYMDSQNQTRQLANILIKEGGALMRKVEKAFMFNNKITQIIKKMNPFSRLNIQTKSKVNENIQMNSNTDSEEPSNLSNDSRSSDIEASSNRPQADSDGYKKRSNNNFRHNSYRFNNYRQYNNRPYRDNTNRRKRSFEQIIEKQEESDSEISY